VPARAQAATTRVKAPPDGVHRPRFTKEGPRRFLIGQYGEVGSATLDRQLFFIDPPDHTRLRRLVARAFTARTVEGLRPRAEEVVGVVDTALERGELDVVNDFAFRIPVRVLATPFAVPDEDCPLLERWGLAGCFCRSAARIPGSWRAGGMRSCTSTTTSLTMSSSAAAIAATRCSTRC
jgi:cytochrome P450